MGIAEDLHQFENRKLKTEGISQLNRTLLQFRIHEMMDTLINSMEVINFADPKKLGYNPSKVFNIRPNEKAKIHLNFAGNRKSKFN